MEQGWNGEWYFGDKSSSDAIIELIHSVEPVHDVDEEPQDLDEMANFLHTHTEVLKRSGYFAAALACPTSEEHLRGKRHFRLQMVSPHSAYRTCIALLYHKYICTSDFAGQESQDIHTTLAVVEVALQIEFQACVDKAFEFLSGRKWISGEAVNIKRFLKKHKLAPREDMVPRLLGPEGYKAYVRRARASVTESLVTAVRADPRANRRRWIAFAKMTGRRFQESRTRAVPNYDIRNVVVAPDPQIREELYDKWLEALEKVRKNPSSRELEDWVVLFQLLLDCNIPDFALSCIASDKSLAAILLETPRRFKLVSLFVRIFGVLAAIQCSWNEEVAVPRSLVYEFCRTWGALPDEELGLAAWSLTVLPDNKNVFDQLNTSDRYRLYFLR